MFVKTFTFGAHEVKAEIDFASLPEKSQQFLIEYGLKQYLGDGAAVSKDDGDTEAKRDQLKADGVSDRIKKLWDGTVSQRNGRVTDPVARAKRDLAVEMHKVHCKQTDTKPLKGDELASWIERFYAKNGTNPKIQAEIEKRVKAMAKLELGEIDLSI